MGTSRHCGRTGRLIMPMGVATFAITVPSFVVAPAQIVFGLWLAWLPVGWNDDAVGNAILPVVALALPQIAVIARLSWRR